MFEFIKKIFIRLLARVVSASSHTKCVSLSNQKFEIQPTPTYTSINLQLNQIDILEVVILLMTYYLSVITGKNESNILTKDISCKCKCDFDGRKCNSNQK